MVELDDADRAEHPDVAHPRQLRGALQARHELALDPGDVLLGEQTYRQGWRSEVARIAAGLRSGLAPAVGLPGVADVRVLGAIGVVQLDRPVDIAVATRAAVAAGVWLRPFRDLIYTMPPYVTDDDDVAAICAGVLAAVTATTAVTAATAS